MAYIGLARSIVKRDGDTFKQIQNVHHIDVVNMLETSSQSNVEIVSGKARGSKGSMMGQGETEKENQRREIDEFELKIKKKLAILTNTETKTRPLYYKRNSDSVPRVGLLGYTNVGKSALLNKLAKKEC